MHTGKSILIVEDARIIALSIQSDLLNQGYLVTGIVDNGDDAILAVEQNPPDLVLMDINLKGRMDGIEASEIILRSRDLPVIYLTAYADDKTIQRARSTSPYGYIIKPYEERNLGITIDFALDRFQLLTQIKQQSEELKNTNKELRATIKKNIVLHHEVSRSEEQMRNIFQSANDGIVILTDQGEVLKANPAGCNMLHLPEGQSTLIMQEYVRNVQIEEIIKSIRKEKEVLFELDCGKSEEERTLEVNGKLVSYEEKPAVQLIIRDITARKEAQLNVLRAIMDTEEQQRKKISTALNNGISPLLKAVKKSIQQEDNLNNLMGLLDQVIKDVEEMAENMSPSQLDAAGFVNTLQTYCKKIKEQHSFINVVFEHDIKRKLPVTVAINLYRFIDELITNSIKHSLPQLIMLSLVMSDTSVVLRYQDDGKGCEMDQLLHESRGLGIRNMLSRVDSLEGHIAFQTGLGKGLTAHIEIPIS